MQYITGLPALNLPCSLDTVGDWHHSSYDWKNIQIRESDGSVLGKWGIEKHFVKERDEYCYTADTLRACLDLLYDECFSALTGMKEDLIDNNRYTPILFEQIKIIIERLIDDNDREKAERIDAFVSKEYESDWITFKRINNIQH